MQLAQHCGGHAAFRCEPRGESFERAAQFDGVAYLGFGKGAHGEAARGNRFDQPFFLKADQRSANRRARHAQPLHHPQFGDALARGELAAQHEFAQTQQRTHGLRGRGGLVVERGVVGNRHVLRRERNRLVLIVYSGASESRENPLNPG
jgi:hypothetical protein